MADEETTEIIPEFSPAVEAAVFPGDIPPEDIPECGDMPRLSMPTPPVSSFDGSSRGAMYPQRLIFGAEDDEEKAFVAQWVQVDDLGGLAPLWAGCANGKVFLHAGDKPEDATEALGYGTPVAAFLPAGGDDPREYFQPQLQFVPVPMEARDGILKNERGQWRRLVWEPLALMDVCLEYLDITRHTLWCIIEGSFVFFFTTVAKMDSALYANGAEARWPYTYYERRNRPADASKKYETDSDKDGGILYPGMGREIDKQYRLAPLPWQFKNGGEIEAEADFVSRAGVRYDATWGAFPTMLCPRYLTTAFDPIISSASAEKALQPDGTFGIITPEDARDAIIESIRKRATDRYSVDPALHEELGRVFPGGIEEGSLYYSTPNEFKVVFSLHIEETATRYPHWLAAMVAHTDTGLLSASACTCYNEWAINKETNEPWPGTPTPDNPGGFVPDDPSGTPDTDNPDGGGDDGGDDGGSEGEPHALETWNYFTAGTNVSVQATWDAAAFGWSHLIHFVDQEGSVEKQWPSFDSTVTVNESGGSYDYEGRTYEMQYGLSVSDSTVTVHFLSTLLGTISYKPTATVTFPAMSTTANWKVTGGLSAFSGRTSLSDFGDFIKATYVKTFTKRGTRKVFNSFSKRYETERVQREFKEYKLSRNDAAIKSYAENIILSNFGLYKFNKSQTAKCNRDDSAVTMPTVSRDKIFDYKKPTSLKGGSPGRLSGAFEYKYDGCESAVSLQTERASWQEVKEGNRFTANFNDDNGQPKKLITAIPKGSGYSHNYL